MKEKDIKELRAISFPLMSEREVLIKPTKRFIDLFTSALDEIEKNAKSEKESEENQRTDARGGCHARSSERKKV